MPLIHKKLEEKRKRLDELEDYDFHREQTRKELEMCVNHLEGFCAQLTEIRKKASRDLVKKIKQGLVDLNFLDVDFDMEFRQMEHFGPSGWDEAQFIISTNPGQPMRPLKDVASGGELSRIMLAIKTVLADSDDIPTLIFDEIDTGISGRTAQKVSEKLSYIAGNHQVICITPVSYTHLDVDTEGVLQVLHKVELKTEDSEYLQARTANIIDKIPEIDAKLNEVAAGWKTKRMGKVELTILRLALFEMAYDDTIPEDVYKRQCQDSGNQPRQLLYVF